MAKEFNRSEKILNIGTLAVLSVWLLVLSLSLVWGVYIVREQTRQVVINVANAYFNKDLAFRLWGSSHGGVYVPVSETAPPNPYLAHLPERDIETPSGRQLTLMNPAYMIREMMSQFSKLTGTSGHLTSLKMLNPINLPDEWERSVLESFEKGVTEVIAFTDYKGEPHLRLMRPFITKEACLKCHAVQGYNVGDVRGGTSISIPLAPYQKIERVTIRTIAGMHLVIFGFGLLGIIFGYRRIGKHIRRHLAMEEEARRQGEFTRTIINSLSHPFLVVDANNYNIILANDAAAKNNRTLAKTCYEMSHNGKEPCNEPGQKCPLAMVKKTKKMVMVEHTHQDGSGNSIDVEVQCFPLFDDKGEVVQVIEYSYDISERKRAEKEKLMLQTQLLQAQKLEAIGTIAGGIAHDFNNILSGVLGYAELAKMSIPQEDKTWGYVDAIYKAGTRAGDLVKQILSFTRKTTRETTPQPVHVVVKEAVSLIKVSLPEGILVVTDIDEKSGSVLIHPTQMHQIVMNLLTNASHAMAANGGTLEVSLSLAEINETEELAGKKLSPGAYVLLLVRDTGMGMDQETMKNIFDPFYTTKDVGHGTGMGLALVHGIVKAAKGLITVESSPGEGTTFRVYFPKVHGDEG